MNSPPDLYEWTSFGDDERSVSEVVGVVMLLAIVTLLAGIIGISFMGFSDESDEPLSVAAIEISEGQHALELDIQGGLDYDDELEIRVNGKKVRDWQQVHVGDKRYLWCLRPGDEVTIVSESQQGDTAVTLEKYEVDSKTDCRFRISQGSTERIVTPLNWKDGDGSARSFYSYGHNDGTGHWHSHLDEDFMESNTSYMFFYEYRGEVSLVMVHDKPDAHCGHGSTDAVEGNCFTSSDEGGGAVNMTFTGLPEEGSWVVKDEPWDFPDDDLEETCGGVDNISSPTRRACWFWYSGNSDGAVLKGGFSGDLSNLEITVYASWNRSSVAWGSVGPQDDNDMINRWAFVTGTERSNEEFDLELEEPLTIEGIEDPEA
jgi:FlaG/FlaF family flagellin (archaellin)